MASAHFHRRLKPKCWSIAEITYLFKVSFRNYVVTRVVFDLILVLANNAKGREYVKGVVSSPLHVFEVNILTFLY